MTTLDPHRRVRWQTACQGCGREISTIAPANDGNNAGVRIRCRECSEITPAMDTAKLDLRGADADD